VLDPLGEPNPTGMQHVADRGENFLVIVRDFAHRHHDLEESALMALVGLRKMGLQLR
jgi:hypothetical protein